MPRPHRLLVPGATYHVTIRGVRRQDIYRDDADRFRFLGILERTIVRRGWKSEGHCLMTNHHHFLVQTPRPDLSAGMQYLNGLYAQWFNERHLLSGHLFERRFWSEPIEDDDYLARVVSYVAMNPVRAGLVDHPADWPWSSFAGVGRDFAFDR